MRVRRRRRHAPGRVEQAGHAVGVDLLAVGRRMQIAEIPRPGELARGDALG